jgi:hypothetical protein
MNWPFLIIAIIMFPLWGPTFIVAFGFLFWMLGFLWWEIVKFVLVILHLKKPNPILPSTNKWNGESWY